MTAVSCSLSRRDACSPENGLLMDIFPPQMSCMPKRKVSTCFLSRDVHGCAAKTQRLLFLDMFNRPADAGLRLLFDRVLEARTFAASDAHL